MQITNLHQPLLVIYYSFSVYIVVKFNTKNCKLPEILLGLFSLKFLANYHAKLWKFWILDLFTCKKYFPRKIYQQFWHQIYKVIIFIGKFASNENNYVLICLKENFEINLFVDSIRNNYLKNYLEIILFVVLPGNLCFTNFVGNLFLEDLLGNYFTL